MLAGRHRQQEVIEYLKAENLALREHLSASTTRSPTWNMKGIDPTERKVRKAHPILFRVAEPIVFAREPVA